MKKIIITLVLFVTAFARAAQVTATFDANNTGAAGVEYFAEEKQADGSWKEVGKADASPIVIKNVVAGPHTYQVRARFAGDPANQSPPSNEAGTAVPLNSPLNVKVTVTIDVTVTGATSSR